MSVTTEEKIRAICEIIEFPADGAVAIAQVESAMGKYLLSRTGARGIFQLTSIAMRDMLEAMARPKHERTGILCGLAFLCLLQDRWTDLDTIVRHYCDPDEKEAYLAKVHEFMENPLHGTNGRMPV